MKNPLVWIIVIALGALAAWYFSVRQDQAEIEQAEVIPAPRETEAESPEIVQYPVEDMTPSRPDPGAESAPPPEPQEPLPALEASDEEVRNRAMALVPEQGLERLLVADFLLSRLVSTVDSLDTRRVALPMRPLVPAAGRFEVLRSDEQAVISPKNAERYAPYVALIEAADTDELVGLYLRYYPLLQEAYAGMGKEETYFNDRAVEMIDLLLATPEPPGMIEVVQNEAVWEFADPELESLAVGQKALLRLSPEDRRMVKRKLQALRGALVGAGPGLRDDNG